LRTVSGQIFKSKFKIQFSGVPEGDHGIGLKNTIKTQYLDRNKLAARTLFTVFIARYDIHDAHSSDLKAIYHLGTLPRELENFEYQTMDYVE
jgi:hypothetical protein